jgi:4-amino-4-deoxy-L-arabinose transferase-like glycosyltransferase/putative flippase GtrA
VLVGLASNILLYLFYLLLTWQGLGAKTAMSGLYILGVLQTFVFNKKWTFNHDGHISVTLWRYLASYGIGYVINFLALGVLVDHYKIAHELVQAVMIITLAMMLFVLQKFWVFRIDTEKSAELPVARSECSILSQMTFFVGKNFALMSHNINIVFKKCNQLDWFAFASIILLAIFVRAIFFTGFFGSDEVTYTDSAVKIMRGDWSVSSYIGALRYGINIPIATFMAIFGVGELSANLWSFLCSIGEIALVYFAANRLWGLRSAVISAGLMVFLPLHVHFAGRLMADAPLAFFITLTFVLFLFAEKSNKAILYLCCGLSMGAVFWIKESVLVFSMIFVFYALYEKKWNNLWLLTVFGAVILLLLNSFFMFIVSGDPFYIFKVILSPEQKERLLNSDIQTSIFYYIKYLLLDIRHTWLLGFFVLMALKKWCSIDTPPKNLSEEIILFWLLGLISVFTFFPMSFHPFSFIMKQTNYMLIFMAPMALISGWWLAQLKPRIFNLLITFYISGSLLLSGLEQQSIHVFTANSKAADEFAIAHPDALVFGLSNAYRASAYRYLVTGNSQWRIQPIENILKSDTRNHLSDRLVTDKFYAIVDTQTIDWGNSSIKSVENIPHCWQKEGVLEPKIEKTAGGIIIHAILLAISQFPTVATNKLNAIFRPLAAPRPAYIFNVPINCLNPL